MRPIKCDEEDGLIGGLVQPLLAFPLFPGGVGDGNIFYDFECIYFIYFSGRGVVPGAHGLCLV